MYSVKCHKCGKVFHGSTPGLAEANMLRQDHGDEHASAEKPKLIVHNRLKKLEAQINSYHYSSQD